MMEIETFSCLRSPTQKVPLNHLKSTYNLLPNMVVDLQSQNTCAVPADPSLHNASHDFKYMPPEGSNHTSPHDFKLLPPEGVVTPSPDNPPTIDSSDIPNDLSYNEVPDGYQSPPNLSPKTMDEEMEDRDCSPSQSPDKHRSRRKPTLEDIVRRMKEVENSDSENSESDGEEEKFNGSMIGPLTIDMQRTGGENADCEADEVDGDVILPECIPNLNRNFIKENGLVSVVEAALQMLPQPLIKDGMSLQVDKSILENGKAMEQGCEGDEVNQELKHSSKEKEPLDISMDTENIHPETDKNRAIHSDKNIDSTVRDMMERISEMTNSTHKLYDSPSTPKLNGWGIHGAFHNSLPLFPFPPSPLEHHLAPNFLPMFDGKFPVQMEHEKDYLKCQYCERTFRRQKNLENHIENTHHGKGPQRRKSGENGTVGDMYFKCTHCPYTTKHQSNLYVHLRIHTGERPYICGACGVQYSQSHSLKSHIINKHDGIMSYYIKEKRNRSPRGMGYLSQVVPDISMYKIPAPIPPNVVPTSMQQPSPQEQHTPLLMPQPKLLPPTPLSACFPSPKQHSPAQNVGHPQLSPQMAMDGIHLHLQTQGLHEHLQSQIHQHQQHVQQQAQHQLQQQQHQQNQQSKSSPIGCNNGHLSPKYINSLLNQQIKPNPINEEPLSLVTHHKSPSQMPLQDISNNPVHTNEECGAIDLSRKSLIQDNPHHHDNQDDHSSIKAGHDSSVKCTDKDCINCVHQAKLRLLRLNVVRMLSILVPNLNFEEKGISADGDSVDELLHDVIESNMQEEEMRE